jgi:hypothetical protein
MILRVMGILLVQSYSFRGKKKFFTRVGRQRPLGATTTLPLVASGRWLSPGNQTCICHRFAMIL